MTVRIFRSTDTGAPVLSGQIGTLINIFDACLVNGYGTTPGLGWTKVFSGTNQAVYKQPANSNKFMLRLEDLTPTNARLVGAESLSSLSDLSTRFPSDTQFSSGVYLNKSSSADSTARKWIMYTNGKIFYFYVNTGNSNLVYQHVHFVFGDITSFKPNDVYNTIIIGGSVPGGNDFGSLCCIGTNAGQGPNAVLPAHYMARSSAQIGGSIQVGKATDQARNFNTTYLGYNGPSYPSPIDGSMYVAPIFIQETNSNIRGQLPGVLNPLHPCPLSDGDIFYGTGPYAGKVFEARLISGGSFTQAGQVFYEISDTW